MRALVLAAGLGTRLRPLTFHLGKPLLPVGRILPGPAGSAAPTTVAGNTLEVLARAGCDAIALNLHHLADQIPAHFGSEQFGVPLHYRFEPEILGTLGPLAALRTFLEKDDDFLLVNGDSLCLWPLAEMLAHHRERGADATLLVLGSEPDAKLGGGLGLDENGEIVQLRQLPARRAPARRVDFAGCHVISGELLREVPAGPGDIVEGLYQKILARGGRLESFPLTAPWHDLGDPRRYLAAIADPALGRGNSISSLAQLGPRVRLERSVVAREAQLGIAAELRFSVLCAGAKVGDGARLDQVIVAPGAEVAAGAELSQVIVLPEQPPHRF